MQKIIRNIFRKFGLEITRFNANKPGEKLVCLNPERVKKGNVLLSLWIEPFLLRDGEKMPTSHSHILDSLAIAQIFRDLGYAVDVIDYRNREFLPQKEYAFFVAFRTNFERLALLLNRDCIKILHIDSAHILFHDAAEMNRLVALKQRRGIVLMPRRFEMPNLAIEHADYATILGNDFTTSTYEYIKKPIYPVPVATPVLYPSPKGKDFDACRKRFLWFGSGGMVHKGVDLLLDAFSQMPDFELFICGPVDDEEDFKQAFYRELFETPNIHAVGWVNIESREFKDILSQCIGIIYPSCSEGQAGSVINCLHAGLIPIISYESGVDVRDFGIILDDCSVETIQKTVRTVSGLPSERLEKMALKSWEFARANHSRERFAEEFRKAIDSIILVHDGNGN